MQVKSFWKGEPQACLFNSRGLGNAGKVQSRVFEGTSESHFLKYQYLEIFPKYFPTVSKYSLNNIFFCSGFMIINEF